MLKHRKWLLAGLVLLGTTYFTAYSDLGTHFLLKGIVIVPIQAAACLWLAYLYWSGQLKGTARHDDRPQSRKP